MNSSLEYSTVRGRAKIEKRSVICKDNKHQGRARPILMADALRLGSVCKR